MIQFPPRHNYFCPLFWDCTCALTSYPSMARKPQNRILVSHDSKRARATHALNVDQLKIMLVQNKINIQRNVETESETQLCDVVAKRC